MGMRLVDVVEDAPPYEGACPMHALADGLAWWRNVRGVERCLDAVHRKALGAEHLEDAPHGRHLGLVHNVVVAGFVIAEAVVGLSTGNYLPLTSFPEPAASGSLSREHLLTLTRHYKAYQALQHPVLLLGIIRADNSII